MNTPKRTLTSSLLLILLLFLLPGSAAAWSSNSVGGDKAPALAGAVPAAPTLFFKVPHGVNLQSGTTCSHTIELNGAAIPGATISGYRNPGGQRQFQTTVGPDGRWSQTVTLPAGQHQFFVTQTIGGRTSPGSNIIAILIGLLTSQPDLATLRLADSGGNLLLPYIEQDNLWRLGGVKDGQTYTILAAHCGSAPNIRLIFGGPLIGTVILEDQDGDGLYQGNFQAKMAAGQVEANLIADSGDTQVVRSGLLIRAD